MVILVACGAIGCPLHAADTDGWPLHGWRYRAVVDLNKPGTPGTPGTDVAAVRIIHNGLARADAGDYRILDAHGKPVPYQVNFHDPRRDTLLSYRILPGYPTVTIYFGNSDDEVDPMRAIVDERPGAGAPKPGPGAGGWIPRAGLTLATYRRPIEAANPQTVSDMATLLALTPGPDGADFHRTISDGFNPFGDSDYYISVYRGWMDLPQAGVWTFCTASNEASFSFIDGRELVHWPGRHTEQRGRFGEKNATMTLEAGPHYVEYYHEEVLLYQMAFLGVKGPGDGKLDRIQPRQWIQPCQAVVQRYETVSDTVSTGGKTVSDTVSLMFAPVLVDSVWPFGRSEGQYTRYRFAPDGADLDNAEGWTIAWSFGDGLSASGAAVEHVYPRMGTYDVVMMAERGSVKIERRWPLTVYPIEHLAGQYRAGKSEDYAKVASGYDAAAMSSADLGELVRLLDVGRQTEPAKAAANLLLTRADAADADRAAANRVLAGDAGTAIAADREGDIEQAQLAARKLRDAVKQTESPAAKLELLARLIRLTAASLDANEPVAPLYEQARQIAQQSGMAGPVRSGMSQVSLAMGDVSLARHDIPAAKQAYEVVEALAEPPLPLPVRMAKSGAYPERISQALSRNQLDDALLIVQRWRMEIPTDQLRGQLLYWQGKVSLLRHEAEDAVGALKLAVRLGGGTEFEVEARWLLAEAYGQMDQPDLRAAALRSLIDMGVAGPWREKAIEAMAKIKENKQ
ncbi:MAG: PKD domain-containing protein [Phycisphaeraceae bacterium]|nr:PKD domain-containing protein [Phycisphaeraceae bacterium]